MVEVLGQSSTRASTPSATAPTFYADGSVGITMTEKVDYVETPPGHYDDIDYSAMASTNPTAVADGSDQYETIEATAGHGDASAPLDNMFLVHITDRKQAEAHLRGMGIKGGCLLRANSQQEIASGTVAMSYLAQGVVVIHHKFVAQEDGTFAMDGKHGAWRSLAQAVSTAKAQAGKKRGLARLTAVTPADGILGINLLPGTHVGAGLVAAENDYVLPDPKQPHVYDSNARDSQDNVRGGRHGSRGGGVILRGNRKGSVYRGFGTCNNGDGGGPGATEA